MADDLPDDFDIIVVGTGFTESCLAAAASRIGKSVLHIDQNAFYGGAWASFNLENFISFLESNENSEVSNGIYTWHNDNTHSMENEEYEITKKFILEKSRYFSLDLCPKVIYSTGQLVQLLISSNICRYAEFRAVDRVCTTFQKELISVPCSRSDVFNTKHLNIVEKRMLMKFINSCLTFGEDKCAEDFVNFRGKTFLEYLQSQKLTEKIITCVMQAIAMCKSDTLFELGVERTLGFLKSIGKYGNTPFLFPMYGCGEIPQCFCRLCAVYGGIYCLKRQIEDIKLETNCQGVQIISEGKTLRAKHIVFSHGSIPPNVESIINKIVHLEPITNRLSRGIFLTTSPLGDEELNSGCGGVNLLRLINCDQEAILIQLSHYSGTCPKGFYVFHITTPAISSQPANDLNPFLEQVFTESKLAPKLIYSAFFTITTRAAHHMEKLCSPIYITDGPSYELDYDISIKNARDIFASIFPMNEFLPRAPDPEEIVVDGEDPSALSENSLPEDLREQLNIHEVGSNEGNRNSNEIQSMEE